MVEAVRELGGERGTVLTFEHDEETERDDVTIAITPVWAWLLRYYGGV